MAATTAALRRALSTASAAASARPASRVVFIDGKYFVYWLFAASRCWLSRGELRSRRCLSRHCALDHAFRGTPCDIVNPVVQCCLNRILLLSCYRSSAETVSFAWALSSGVRTPFMTSGTAFKDLISQELARAAVKGLVTKTAVDATKDVDYVCMGTVIQEGALSCLTVRTVLRLACCPFDALPSVAVVSAVVFANLLHRRLLTLDMRFASSPLALQSALRTSLAKLLLPRMCRCTSPRTR